MVNLQIEVILVASLTFKNILGFYMVPCACKLLQDKEALKFDISAAMRVK